MYTYILYTHIVYDLNIFMIQIQLQNVLSNPWTCSSICLVQSWQPPTIATRAGKPSPVQPRNGYTCFPNGQSESSSWC